jgi:beta-lactam-binding protein with PASTA domain
VLDAVVARALVKDPAGRFQSAEEFVLALDEARRAIASGTGGAAQNTAGFVPVGPPPPLGPEDSFVAPPDEEPRERGKWPFIALALLALALIGFAVFKAATKTEHVEIPRVTGLDVGRARARLERKGLSVAVHDVRNKKDPGAVLGSDPAAGKSVDKGSKVTLLVSSGPGQVTVPTVTGFSESRAQKALAKVGFKYQSKEQSSDSVAKGRVIRTSPPSGTDAPYGSRVILVVSSGPEQVSVPSVVGLTLSSATNALESRGLNVSVTEQESDKPKDEVLSQSPSAGGKADKGTTITLTVSKGRSKVDVPDVVGLSAAKARARLTGAGFSVRVKERESDAAGDGKVVDQTPGGGAQRVKGSTVTIVVGKAPKDQNGDTTDELPPPPDSGSGGTSGGTSGGGGTGQDGKRQRA